MLTREQKTKTRVRLAKMCLRVTNFSCSLIVLAMLSTVFTIFNATRALPKRGNASPWAKNQQIWPQIVLLSIACVSLVACIAIFYAYWKGGHRRAEKATIYYTVFSVIFFTFSIVIWAIGAGVLNQAKKDGNGQDMWGWSCKEGKRKEIFKEEVDYDLVCRLQVSFTLLSSLYRSCAHNPAELGIDLRLHRNHRGNHYHRHLCHCLLPILFKATSSQVHGRAGQCSQGPLPCPTPHAIGTKHAWLSENPNVGHLSRKRAG